MCLCQGAVQEFSVQQASYHRVIGWVGLEGTFKCHLVAAHCCGHEYFDSWWGEGHCEILKMNASGIIDLDAP